MKRKLIIITLIILGISMISGGVLVIAGFFGGAGDINKGLVGHWKMDNLGSPSLSTGLVGQWKFNGDTTDETSYGNDAVNFGADLTTDRQGQSNKAYNFVVGNTDYMEIPDSANWNFGDDDYAISFWMNKTTDITQVLFIQSVADSTANYQTMTIYDNGNQIIWSAVKDSVGAMVVNVTGISGFGTGVWHHIVFTRVGSSVYMYLNGSLIGQDDTITTHPNIAAVWTLGRRVTGSSPDRYFNGKIDDFRIYNSGLSQDQVTALYNHYDYDTVAEDSTPNNNEGIINGVSLTTDRKGQANKAYSFDGDFDYIDIPGLDKSNLYSFSAWIKVTSLSSTRYIYNEDGAGYSWMRVDTSGSVSASTYDSTDHTYSTATGLIEVGNWYHVANVVDIANDRRQIYINGILEKDDTTDVNNLGTLNPWRISHSHASLAFNGSIDDVRIYDRALSPLSFQ